MKESKQDNLEIELVDTEEKISFEEALAKVAIDKLENPFAILTVKDVAKDLNIGKNASYKIFKRKDFPSVNLGQSWHITLLAYTIWKMQRHV